MTRIMVDDQPAEKITLILLERQVSQLDELTLAIRRRWGRVLQRSVLIRAVVEAAIVGGIDLTSSASAGEITAQFMAAIRKRKP